MNPYLSTLEEFGLHHSSDYSKGAKRIDYYVPDHHWKSPVQVVTHLRKGEPFKFEWRGSGMTSGTTVEGLRKYLENDLAKYNAMVERHRTGSGEFAPGRQNPEGPSGWSTATKFHSDSEGMTYRVQVRSRPRYPQVGSSSPWFYFQSHEQLNDFLREVQDRAKVVKFNFSYIYETKGPRGWQKGEKGLIKSSASNPGRGWFTRCLDSVSASGSAVDPGAVCGAQLKKMGYRRRNPESVTYVDRTDAERFAKYLEQIGNRNVYVYQQGNEFRVHWDKTKYTRRKNLSIRKYKKGRLSGYEEATGRAVKWFRARGKRTRAARKAKRIRTNPTKRYQIRAAGRVFTVSAKTKRAAQAEVSKYCRQHGLKSRTRNPYDRTTGQWSSSDRWIVEQQRGGIGFRGHGWKVIRRMGGEVYGTYDYKGDAIRTAEILNEQLDNPRRRRRTRRNSWTDNRKGHSEAAKLGWERRRLASKRKKKRNRRSASMLSPRTGRRTIRSVERRTSQALRRYLGGRR